MLHQYRRRAAKTQTCSAAPSSLLLPAVLTAHVNYCRCCRRLDRCDHPALRQPWCHVHTAPGEQPAGHVQRPHWGRQPDVALSPPGGAEAASRTAALGQQSQHSNPSTQHPVAGEQETQQLQQMHPCSCTGLCEDCLGTLRDAGQTGGWYGTMQAMHCRGVSNLLCRQPYQPKIGCLSTH